MEHGHPEYTYFHGGSLGIKALNEVSDKPRPKPTTSKSCFIRTTEETCRYSEGYHSESGSE